MKRLRVLIVDDSLTIRRRLAELFTADGTFEVVGEALDGQQAFEHCHRLRPDVVTMDLMMPKLDGLRSTELIMAHCPTPIVVLSAAESRTEGQRTMDALAAGAVDAVDKPSGVPDAKWSRTFLERVRMAARVRVITHVRARFQREPVRPPPVVPAVPTLAQAPRLLVVGASTGGPAAVSFLLGALPPGFPLPMLLVLHTTEQFDTAMVEWLEARSGLQVRKAVDGEALPLPGRLCVRMAPGNRHMVVRGGRLWLEDGPERHSCRPSVDTLFESVARELGASAIGCLLTGMGRDGAEGLGAMRRAGATTVVEDESTCVVFGMPREAIRLGAAQHVVGLTALPLLLTALARADAREGTA
ncbi:Chemotaxis response regulator protein-glutamate methylesterase CheB [Cystobacter fuscus DSM 2262]|uniref:Protein-glutamate methylesterase/protein-glutamine glutaminase n=1 Tax=Cystobacter fuscus (strain ATCC 25194 / DSM 2262 / NBRC 100088 / M29) TaxID=1242864 RepID=S9P4R2_CYSF2|nr:chemotaxis-specific protein-glutamate methyltransferase CheB [Cystobacter fuscus]EPX59455.1 Chemotaxis response regulator protein-glutamate methylesterase CheB [Cystobacter fuscus DSM 2262]